MIIKAVVRLQGLGEDGEASCFIAKGARPHGKGPVSMFEVTGGSWVEIRRTLRAWLVTGVHRVRSDSVESWRQDIGTDYSRLRRLPNTEVK